MLLGQEALLGQEGVIVVVEVVVGLVGQKQKRPSLFSLPLLPLTVAARAFLALTAGLQHAHQLVQLLGGKLHGRLHRHRVRGGGGLREVQRGHSAQGQLCGCESECESCAGLLLRGVGGSRGAWVGGSSGGVWSTDSHTRGCMRPYTGLHAESPKRQAGLSWNSSNNVGCATANKTSVSPHRPETHNRTHPPSVGGPKDQPPLEPSGVGI